MLITEAEKDLSCVLFFFFNRKRSFNVCTRFYDTFTGVTLSWRVRLICVTTILTHLEVWEMMKDYRRYFFFFSATECGVDFLVYRNLCLLCAWGLR